MLSVLDYFDIKLGLYDICLAIIYFGVLYIIAFYYKRVRIAKNPEHKYFILGLTAKVIGGFTFALLTIYYWKGGDSMGYYATSVEFSNILLNNPISGIKLLFTSTNSVENYHLVQSYFSAPGHEYIKGDEVFFLVKITAILNLIGLYSYGTTTILFASISFIGIWAAYSNFCKIYPNYSKHLMISFFMIPSIVFWGSGVLKDTVTMSCMGWLIYSFSNIFIFKRKIFVSVVIILVASYFILLLKPYILYVLLPSLLIWGQTNLKNLIKGSFIRIILIPIIVLSISLGTIIVLQKISSEAGRYDIQTLQHTLEGFQSWHGYLATTQDQSGYTLGEMEFTPVGYLKIAPAGFNVTFFRPYLWEIRNVPTLIGAVESLLLFFFVLYLLITLRGKFFKIIFKNKDIFFMMIFSVIFGIIVGISSYNFGALSRYKMPAQLLFVTALFLIYNIAKDERKANSN